ncbi:MAG TPA: glycosyltransferase family 4 protein [Vicinamibacteria bacterium]
MKARCLSALAFLLACSTYSVALGVSALFRLIPRRRRVRSGRLALIGTFFNANWFVSHATPLARSGLQEVVVVTDEPQPAPPGVRFVCPPSWATGLLGRVGAKLLSLVGVGWKDDPDAFMGYHIFPNSIFALIAGRLFGRPACYQMTGGPIEVTNGGIDSENRLFTLLRRPSPFLERLALAVVRQFDLIVVRGTSAKAFLRERGVRAPIAIIPGSVDPARFQGRSERKWDMVFVGRLTDTKQPLQFVEILGRVAKELPSVRAVLFGDGPLLEEVRGLAERLRVGENLELRGRTSEVVPDLAASRVFVLTSRSEGLSIAMAEAMMCGVVPVVADVGDLSDLVQHAESGYLVPPGDTEAFASHVVALLKDARLWTRLSANATAAALAHVGIDRVTALWVEQLATLC